MSRGRFGIHGGQYIPETLMNAVLELEEAYEHYKNDPEFNRELTELLNDYAGRPSRLYYAAHMTEDLGGAKVYLKREDLNHTGAHKINNVLGQVLLAKKMGKTRVIERIPDAASGGKSPCSYFRYGHFEGCCVRNHAGVDEQDRRHSLCAGLCHGASSVSDDRAGFSGCDLKGDQRTDSGKRRTAA